MTGRAQLQQEIVTFQVQAADGDLGSMDDFIMEDANWFIRYLVTCPGGWLSGQKLLVATRSVGSIEWSQWWVDLDHELKEL